MEVDNVFESVVLTFARRTRIGQKMSGKKSCAPKNRVLIAPCRWQVANMKKTAWKYAPHLDCHNKWSWRRQCYDLKSVVLELYGSFDSYQTTSEFPRIFKHWCRSSVSCYVNEAPWWGWIRSAGKCCLL